jgi:hypothetical protein
MATLFPNTETCFVDLSSNGLNPSLFPVGTAQHLDINYNILPFLCDLLKATTDNNVSPLLTEGPTPFDLTPYTDFSMLTGVGDPRASLGETMTQTYIHFLPRVITQTEVRQAGGTQVIDNYICTDDGSPIKISETIPVLLSLDLTGKKPYQYGAITVPPVSATFSELMRIIDPQEVKDFVNSYINGARERHAEDFSNFIKQYFSDWKILSIDVYEATKHLIVSLKKNNKTAYIKYHSDVAQTVGCLLKLKEVKYFYSYQPPENMALSMAMSSLIKNFKLLMQNPKEAEKYRDLIINNYSSTPDQSYSSLSQNPTAAQLYYNSYSSNINSINALNPQLTSIKIVEC